MEYKRLKGLKKENLRDNMTNPQTMDEHADVAHRGGSIAREARLKLEPETGNKVVTPLNAKSIHQIETSQNKEE